MVDVDTARRDRNDVAAADGTAAVYMGDHHQASVSGPSSRPAAGACCPALQSAAYVPLPQLIDHISPYTAVDTANA